MSEKKAVKAEPKFTKGQIVGSKKFEYRKDLLNVILSDDKLYTIAEVEKAITNYLKQEV